MNCTGNARSKAEVGVGRINQGINIRLMESAEAAANFANISRLPNPTLLILGALDLFAASSVTFKLPSSTLRYIKGVAIGENASATAGGTACGMPRDGRK